MANKITNEPGGTKQIKDLQVGDMFKYSLTGTVFMYGNYINSNVAYEMNLQTGTFRYVDVAAFVIPVTSVTIEKA